MPNPWTGVGNPDTREEFVERMRSTVDRGEPIIVGGHRDQRLGFWAALRKVYPKPMNNAAGFTRRATCSTMLRRLSEASASCTTATTIARSIVHARIKDRVKRKLSPKARCNSNGTKNRFFYADPAFGQNSPAGNPPRCRQSTRALPKGGR